MARWFFLEGHLDKLDLLLENKIPAMELSVGTREGVQKGISFTENNQKDAFKLLGIDVKNKRIEEFSTSQENTFWVKFKEKESKTEKNTKIKEGFNVEKTGGDLETWDTMLPILEEFSKQIKKDIHVCNPHGRSTSGISNAKNKLSIVFWSHYNSFTSRGFPYCFGRIMKNGATDGCLPNKFNDKGIVLKDDDDVVFGEIIGSTLYVFFDLPHQTSDGARFCLEKVIEAYLKVGLMSKEEYEKYLEKEIKKKQKIAKEKYVKACSRRYNETLNNLKEQIPKFEKKINDFSEGISECVRNRAEALEQLEFFEAQFGSQTDRYGNEFDNLLNVDKVEDVFIEDAYIIVITKEIEINYEDQTYLMGTYKVKIPIGRGNLYIIRIEGTIEGCYHPHVNGDAAPCLGNIATGLAKLIGQYEFAAAVQVILNFLSEVNKDDWYARVTVWPVKKA